MANAFGIVNFSGKQIWVDGMQTYRPIGAFSFLGRYRVIDFPISNLTNSGIEHIQVYIRKTAFSDRASRNRTPLQYQLQERKNAHPVFRKWCGK